GLRRLLASPQFLVRAERVPANLANGQTYRITELELASRLSFFLWSTIPDDQLINLAAQGRLSNPVVLEQQVRRMLADPRSPARAALRRTRCLRGPISSRQSWAGTRLSPGTARPGKLPVDHLGSEFQDVTRQARRLDP